MTKEEVKNLIRSNMGPGDLEELLTEIGIELDQDVTDDWGLFERFAEQLASQLGDD